MCETLGVASHDVVSRDCGSTSDDNVVLEVFAWHRRRRLKFSVTNRHDHVVAKATNYRFASDPFIDESAKTVESMMIFRSSKTFTRHISAFDDLP